MKNQFNPHIKKVNFALIGKENPHLQFTITFDSKNNRDTARASLLHKDNAKKPHLLDVLQHFIIASSTKKPRLFIRLKDSDTDMARFKAGQIEKKCNKILTCLEKNKFIDPAEHKGFFFKLITHLHHRFEKMRNDILSKDTHQNYNQNSQNEQKSNYTQYGGQTQFGSYGHNNLRAKSNTKKNQDLKTSVKKDRGSQGYSSQEEDSPEKVKPNQDQIETLFSRI